MKILYLCRMLFLLLSTFILLSCSNDDNVEISNLAGNKWKVVYANPTIDGCDWKEYHFNEDNTCVVGSYTELPDGKINAKIALLTYVVSVDENILTLKTEERNAEQYRIRNLKSEYMNWENAMKGDGNPSYVELKRSLEESGF